MRTDKTSPLKFADNPTKDNPLGLSPNRVRIAKALCEGQSTRQIAQASNTKNPDSYLSVSFRQGELTNLFQANQDSMEEFLPDKVTLTMVQSAINAVETPGWGKERRDTFTLEQTLTALFQLLGYGSDQ